MRAVAGLNPRGFPYASLGTLRRFQPFDSRFTNLCVRFASRQKPIERRNRPFDSGNRLRLPARGRAWTRRVFDCQRADVHCTTAAQRFQANWCVAPRAECVIIDGDVLIRDAADDYQNMQNEDGTWLDATDPDWVSSSFVRWDGLVEDSQHGRSELFMPVVTEGEPLDLIKRGSESGDSYEHQAGLKFVDGQVYYWE